MLIPNHGLGYLATALKLTEHQPIIVDCIRDHIDPAQFLSRVNQEKVSVVGIQVYTFDLEILDTYIQPLKEAGVTVIAGGPHPSADPIHFMTHFAGVDYCFQGEAERTLPLLLDHISEFGSQGSLDHLASIPGLYFRRDGGIEGSPPEFFENLDALGFPDWEQISPLTYPIAPQGTFTKRLPYAPIIVTRGCPYPCTFCAGKLVSGRKIRTRSVKHVISELKYLVDTFGIREFHIQDDNFTHNREYVIDFCARLVRANLDLSWACPNGIRLDSLDEEMLIAMDKAGCYSVAVGIESGTQRVLDLMKKRSSIADIISKIKLVRRTTNWHITGFFILGYPGETEVEMKTTIRFARSLPLDKANFGILMPLPGTEATDAAITMGWNPDRDLQRMSEYRSPFTPDGISPAKFRWLFRWAFISFYARPKIVFRFIRQIHTLDQVKILVRRLWDVIAP
jgi:radical SAM superfamily enzyme YgiQ (UPF0313 family)